MNGGKRPGRYAFRPWASGRAELERRDQPSGGIGRFDGTVAGQYRSEAVRRPVASDQGATLAGAGRDTKGRTLRLVGDLANPGPGAASAGETVGSAKLTTGRARYAFTLTGPRADLSSPSGLANLTFAITRSRRAGVGPVVARGSIQVNWHPGLDGTSTFTAAIHADPVAVKGRSSR